MVDAQNAVDTFKYRLESDWKLHVACQRQCHARNRNCTCNKSLVHVAKFDEWIQRKDTDDTNSVIERLLLELHPKMKSRQKFIFESKAILEGDKRCVLVFGILLNLGHGDLIDIFYNHNVVDQYLRLAISDHLAPLRADLVSKNACQSNDVANKIINDFEKAKWAFCHPPLTLYMNENFEGAKFILPFCRHNPVNCKGGTATVFQVSIQEELVTNKPLAKALEKSLHSDPIYGSCYKMAVKSYSSDTKDIYEAEKQAFLGLRGSHDTPIVKCLGSFSHNDGERKTYNLLLEYGEMDLDEFCADVGNVPPVGSKEIIRFWDSLFEVAKAIQTIHEVHTGRGSTWKKYNGWHADIKPDNILRVGQEFKLADFGFAKFAEAVEDDKTPEQFIMGGTDTYGAPEFARAKRAETQSAVKQTIDTWSFGCVLSVAATWVVLGYQGMLQFWTLRTVANGERKKGGEQSTDRFHDGKDVLPEIKSWHRYLANHVRIGDTITAKVLNLINEDMLKADPEERLTSTKLCKELDKILSGAEGKRKAMLQEGTLSETEFSTQYALLVAEKAAPSDSNTARPHSASRPGPVQLDLTIPGVANTLRVNIDPAAHQSKRIGKDEKLQKLPLAKTPHREQILEKELGSQYKVFPVGPAHAGNGHNGAKTDSPTGMYDIFHGPTARASDAGASRILSDAVSSGLGTAEERLRGNHGSKHWKRGGQGQDLVTAPSVHVAVPPVAKSMDVPLLDVTQLERITHVTIEDATPQKPEQPAKEETPNNLIPETPQNVFPHTSEQHLERSQVKLATSSLPPNVYDLPWDICRIRKILEERVPKGTFEKAKAMFTNWLSKEYKKDKFYKYLGNFINDRDMVFVIDNDSSMREFWGITTFVADTLAMQLAGLDDDGIDAWFTVKGKDLNCRNMKGLNGLKLLHNKLEAGRPDGPWNGYPLYVTDMAATLSSIFNEYWKGRQKKTTLIVLTNGRWQGSKSDLIFRAITDFAKELESDKRRFLDRHFSITFVRLGDDPDAIERLEFLDDQLCVQNRLKDIIDSCTWKDTVEKILLGSVTGYQDDQDQAAQSVVYDEVALNKLFNDFDSSATISPSPRRSPSSSSLDLQPADRAMSALSTPTGKMRNSLFGRPH